VEGKLHACCRKKKATKGDGEPEGLRFAQQKNERMTKRIRKLKEGLGELEHHRKKARYPNKDFSEGRRVYMERVLL